MDFTINKAFANSFNQYRRTEELQKLKDRYGSCSGKKKKLVKKYGDDEEEGPGDDEEAAVDSEASSSESDTSSSDSDSSQAEQDNIDFLHLYSALSRNDPSLNDPSKQWFHDNADAAPAEQDGGHKARPISLRDHERNFLLEHGGLENEEEAREAERVARMESDEVIESLTTVTTSRAGKNEEAESAKALFLAESEKALNGSSKSPAASNDFLHKRPSSPSSGGDQQQAAKRHRKDLAPSINLEGVSFTDVGDPESDRFLRDYFVNQRWRSGSKKSADYVPHYNEVLQEAGVSLEPKSADKLTLSQGLDDDEQAILDEDDDFLVRVHDVERDLSNQFEPPTKTQYRFEEPDQEFIKTYPRRIESSIHQSLVSSKQSTTSRSAKRQARLERKKAAKQARLADLDRLKQLEQSAIRDKLARLRKSCGPLRLGQDLESDKLAQLLAKEVDQDGEWDPARHDELLSTLFDDAYYEVGDHDLEIGQEANQLTDEGVADPTSLDDDDVNDDGESSGVRPSKSQQKSGSGRAAKSDVKSLIDKALAKKKCEDVISGGEHQNDTVYCKFKYRQVPANDYGLTTKEILTCSGRELNSWVPITRVTGYLSQLEEERNQRIYQSQHKLDRKNMLLPSLSDPNAHWLPHDDGDNRDKDQDPDEDAGVVEDEGEHPSSTTTVQPSSQEPPTGDGPIVSASSSGKKKRHRKRKKRSQQQSETDVNPVASSSSAPPPQSSAGGHKDVTNHDRDVKKIKPDASTTVNNADSAKTVKRRRHFAGAGLSEARLQALGLQSSSSSSGTGGGKKIKKKKKKTKTEKTADS